MNLVTIRFNDGIFFASCSSMKDYEVSEETVYYELEGSGETISDALRDLAEVIETTTI